MALDAAIKPDGTPPESAPGWLSYEEFLRWDGENQHVEWVGGKVFFKSPISREHSDVGLFLAKIVPPGVDGVYRSAAFPGLWIKADWLWQSPLPTTLSVLKEWKLI